MSLDKLTTLANKGRELAVRPQANGDWYRIENANSDRAKMYIYGVIGSDFGDGDVTASSFVQDLKNVTASSIDLHINSPGGLVFDGVSIYSALLNHKAPVNVSVDGIAASAASFVAMAGDSIGIEKPAKMMIHDARGLVIGSAEDMTDMASLLDELSNTIAEIYADRSGGETAEWRAAMRAETWYSANQAVSAGLADFVANDTTATAENRGSQLIRARHRAARKG